MAADHRRFSLGHAGFGLTLAFACLLAASPASAKKAEGGSAGKASSENGGLFQPPTAIAKPALVLDTVTPKVETSQDGGAPAALRAGIQETAAKTLKPADTVKTIDSLRLHSLFE